MRVMYSWIDYRVWFHWESFCFLFFGGCDVGVVEKGFCFGMKGFLLF